MPPLTVIGPPSHNIIAVPYNAPPYILSLQCHIMPPPPYILSLQCHIMDFLDCYWTPLHIIIAVSYNGPPLHIIIAVSYNGPPLHIIIAVSDNGPPLHIIIAVSYNGPPYILSLQCHIMDPLDRFWTPLHNIIRWCYGQILAIALL